MFELLAPYFAVAGGLLAGVPIVLHMFRRTPALKMPFSVVRFLSPTLPKTTKRSTVEHWPLMLLRILAVALIALAFARPFQRITIAKAAEAGSADRIALLLDASASMRRDGLRDAVIAEIQKVVADLHDEDTLSVALFSQSTKTLISAAEWRQTEPSGRSALIERATTSYEPDWLSTNTATAMLETADEVAREEGAAGPDGERRVILVTDFQQGSKLDELRSGTWPDSVKLDLRIVSPTTGGNAGVSLVEDDRSGLIRVRVSNSGDAAMTKYSLQSFDVTGKYTGAPLPVDVGGGQRRTFTMPDAVEGQPRPVGVELLGDPHPFDNVLDLPIDESSIVRIAHAGSINANDADSMRYYLQRVLDGNETDPVEIIDLLGSDGVAIPVPSDVRLAIVTETIPESLAKSLNEFADMGGMLLVAIKSAEMASSVKALLPENMGIEEAIVKDYAMFGQIDFSGTLLSVFADARFADFSGIRFWHYRTLTFDEKQPNSPRVLARFDTGAPAMLELTRPTVGKVFILAAGWHPNDSQWALSTRFPPMIHRLVQLANPRQSGHQLREVGERIDPKQLAGTDQWTLTPPGGAALTASEFAAREVSVAGDQPSTLATDPATVKESKPATSTILLNEPGRWVVTGDSGDGPKSLSLFVTVAASESRTEPLPAGQLQAMGMSSSVASVKDTTSSVDPASAAQLDAGELESQQKFWRWLLLAGLAFLALEAIVSFMLERRQHIEAV